MGRIAEVSDPGRRVVSEQLLPVVGAQRHARDVVTEACLRWDFPDLVDPASLIVSELVANVVDHAHTMMTLTVAHRGSHLYLAVQDGASAPPVARTSVGGTVALRGRGLLLVEAIAATWGYSREGDGKIVWATLAPHS